MNDQPNVVIVGAGIVGASIAWHVAQAGGRVTVVEAGELGGIATRSSLAWINASWGNPKLYFQLRVRAMDEWRTLERRLPRIRVVWGGGLIWDLPPEELEAFAAEHESWGYSIRRVDRAEAQQIEPQLTAPPAFALHAANEGSVEPLTTVRELLAAAMGLGATVVDNTAVRSIDMRAGRVGGVTTDAGHLAADWVVIAAGVRTSTLAESAGLKLLMRSPPGLLVSTKPNVKLLNGLLLAPELHLRQTADGRLVAAAELDGADVAVAAARTFESVKALIRSGALLAMDSYSVAVRPIPQDGFPVIGAAEGPAGLYVAVTHSGITLAPLIGRLVAEEIMTGSRDPLLAPYRPERFLPK